METTDKPKGGFGEFVKAQFDKVLLCFLTIFLSVFLILLLWHFPNLDQATLQWAEKSIDIVLGALITTITTAVVMGRKESHETTVTGSKDTLVVTPEKK